MEQPSSTEMPMAPVYGNMANLCLLCASAQNPEDQPFIDIHGECGKQMMILEKIHKLLAIKIEAGFPLQVCASCVSMLNICHKFVQYSERAFEKLKNLQKEWESEHEIAVEQEPLQDDDWSQTDFGVPFPNEEHLEEDNEFQMEIQPEKKSKKETLAYIQSQEFPMLQKPFHVVKGSQLAIFLAEEDAEVKFQFTLSLVLIKWDGDGCNNKESTTEKVSRIIQHIKESSQSKQTESKRKGTNSFSSSTSNELLHSCHSCQCSFFLQEEMVSHFESLHPEEVHQCSVCDEKICGPVQMQEKHMDLHQALEKDQMDDLLSTLQVPSVKTNIFDPEFVVVELGIFPARLHHKLSEVVHGTFKYIIQRNVWIKPDMKDPLCDSLHILATNIRRYKDNRRSKKQVQKPRPKVECDVCGKKMQKKCLANHMLSHNPKRVKSSHLCDLCGKVFMKKGNLRKHLQSAHFPDAVAPLYPCDLCDAVYKTKPYLRRHKISAHGPKYPCEVCGKHIAPRSFPRHMKYHDDDCKIPCKHCGKLFINQALCEFHEITIHEGVSVRCKICPLFYFKSVKGMEEHNLRHERGEEIIFPRYLQPVQCSVCSENFPNSISLRKHMNVHGNSGNKRVLPRRKRKSGSRNTEKKNDGPPPQKKRLKVKEVTVPCYSCLIRFMTQESFDSHIQIHHPGDFPNIPPKPLPKNTEFQYQCRYCDKTFKTKDFCNDHENLHGGEKQYACDFCGQRYSSYSEKWTHQTEECTTRVEVVEIDGSVWQVEVS